MNNLVATITALMNFQGTLNRTFGDAVAATFNQKPSTTFAFGTGANQINTFYRAARTLAPSANEDLDLSGVLTDDYGAVITFTEVKALFIQNTSAVDTLTVGAAASNALSTLFGATTHTLKIPPASWILICSSDATGYGVTAGTADLLRIANGAGGSTTYNILIAGN